MEANMVTRQKRTLRVLAAATTVAALLCCWCSDYGAGDALWEKKMEHTVITFDANGGNVSPTTGNPGADGKLTFLPTPDRDGYKSIGWFTAATGGTRVTLDKVYAGNTTIYAHWAEEFTDERDKQVYTMVKIGNQTWMAENLNYVTADKNGSWCYGNDAENCVKYGRLYNWKTAMGGADDSTTSNVRGVCPEGWHLPTRAEWGDLAKSAGGTGDYGTGGTAGTKLKSISGWYYNNGTDDYGFSALPGGRRDFDGNVYSADYNGFWWTASEGWSGCAYARGGHYNYDYVGEYDNDERNAFSVRCVKDND